jgi:phosphoribosyl 1,2-cyclic phosphodiesterase
MQNSAKLVFWGVRGSTPTLDRDTWRYGGNTPCLELTTPEGTRFILDCGTGLRSLGKRWATQTHSDFGTEAHVLMTHYHWDHIQGIPFFLPFFEAQNKFRFYSFQSKFLGTDTLRQVFESQLASPYFPVDVGMMASARSYREVTGGEKWEVDGTRITTAWLNHPQGCLGYRLDTTVGSIVYATDNEPGVQEFDKTLRQFAQGADVMIYDAQYSPEQVASTRKGWGHSSWLEGTKIAKESGVKNLVLFHHNPDSSDSVVDGFLSAARQEFPCTWAAAEGLSVALGQSGVDMGLKETRMAPRHRLNLTAVVRGRGEDGREFEEQAVVRDLSIQGAHLMLKNRPKLQSELRVAIEPNAEHIQASATPLRATVVHCNVMRENPENGVGITFIAEVDPASPSD